MPPLDTTSRPPATRVPGDPARQDRLRRARRDGDGADRAGAVDLLIADDRAAADDAGINVLVGDNRHRDPITMPPAYTFSPPPLEMVASISVPPSTS